AGLNHGGAEIPAWNASVPPACGPEARRPFTAPYPRCRSANLRHRAEIGGDLDHAVRKAPFIVIPGQDADKSLVEHLGLGHVEGRAVWIVVEIHGHGWR